MSNILSTAHPELVSEWLEKNLPLTPDKITYGSNKLVWWKGKCGHEWIATDKSRTISSTGCPYCSHNAILEGFNDLASQMPEIAEEWSEKNDPLLPNQVTAFANRKVWWKCKECGNEWHTLIRFYFNRLFSLLRTISKVKRCINPDLAIDGILLTIVDNRTNLAKSTVEALRQNFGSHIKIYKSQIPMAVKAAEVASKGESIFAYEPNSPVSKAYSEFTKEVLADGKQKERLHSAHIR